ncbi:MAG: hypothetical protein HYX75_25625 [Acidobacteria bacterium]|nr:hypothetical protein [Acidobacteriota bacterium]
MKRRMIVTVGASLFHSASWKNEGPFQDIQGYGKWFDGDRLDHPSKRLSIVDGDRGELTGAFVREQLRRLLSASSASQLSQFVAQDLDRPLRYSAEISTILKLHAHHRNSHNEAGFGSFLHSAYERVIFVCAAAATDDSYIAAQHLSAQLAQVASLGAGLVRVSSEIEGETLEQRTECFGNYLGTLARTNGACDLVVSGGYKIYGIQAALILPQQNDWRLIYLHEDDEDPQLVGFTSRGYLPGEDLASS